jgi:transposase
MMCGVRRADQLPNDIEVLKRLVLEQQVAIESHQLEIERLKLILARLRRARFGRSSEALDQQIEQLELTLEELEAAQAATEVRTVSVTKKIPQKPVRQELPENLPRELQVHEAASGRGVYLPGMRRHAAGDGRGCHGGPGTDSCTVQSRSAHTPQVQLREVPDGGASPGGFAADRRGHRRRLGHCAGAGVQYCDYSPLYRQSQIYAREGVELPRSTLAEWVGQAAQLCHPLVEAIARHVLRASKLHADDTPVPVLCPGKGTTKTGRLWVYVRDDRGSADLSPPAVLFRYSPDRKAIYPNRHLESFHGILQAYAYAYAGFKPLYERAEDPVLEAAYWAHARRRFYDIYESNDSPIARQALERIAALYEIEDQIRGRPPDERKAVRQARASPLLQDLKHWLIEAVRTLSKKSELAVAIRYALSRWNALVRYCEDGRIDIDNNAAERALRAVALGRKNFLFAGSDSGGERAACMYTLIG